MTAADLLALYLAGCVLFIVAIGIAVRSRIGWRTRPNMGFRRELLEFPIIYFFVAAWPVGILRWRWLVERWVSLQRPAPEQVESNDPLAARRELRLAVVICAVGAPTFFIAFADARKPFALALGCLALAAMPILLRRLAASKATDPK